MKVLQILSSLDTGGAEKLITDSVHLYQRKQIKVDVISLRNKKTPFWEILEKTSNGTIIGLTTKSLYNPFLVFKIIPHLKNYDIVHAHLFPTLYWVVIAKILSFSKIKIVYTEHSTNNRRRDKLVFKFLDRIIYKKIDKIVAITQGVKENLQNHLGNNIKIDVIFNGIDLEKFKYTSVKNDYDYFNEDDFKLIQVSSFRPQKDQKTVINSLKLLPDNVKLILVGDGVLLEPNKKLVSELNLESRVLFLGNRYDIPQLISYCDVVLLSSVWEGFGLAAVEGMASKKAVIASNIEGIKDIVKDYGLLFEKGNEEELAKLITELKQNEELYASVSLSCYKRSQDFDINKMIESYVTIYQLLLQ